MNGRSRDDDPDPDGALSKRQAWRLAAALVIVGAISTIPALLLLETDVEQWKYAFTALGVLTGILCVLLPLHRLPRRWLAVVPVIATIEVAVAVEITQTVFSYLYFFVAVYVALVFPQPRRMAPYLVLIVVALVAPIFYADDSSRDVLLWALAIAPGLALTAVMVGRFTHGLETSREEYRRLSDQDALTGVGNYRALLHRLQQETARHRRRYREFSVLALDLDDFKQLNETQGHLAGDLVLTIVGSTLGIHVRTEDTVFRQGGDEFSVIAPETSRRQAERLAERLETALAQITTGDRELSATVGVAVYPDDGSDPLELLDAADTALLARKRASDRTA
ncbi:MAG: GGDEF domain-containing protein [Solirubrobacterales bacterium]|nr:GGDEF domain-containing protein [Solirubrobacterales bacterium]